MPPRHRRLWTLALLGSALVLLIAAGYALFGRPRHVAAPYVPPPPGCQAGTGVQAIPMSEDQAAIAATIAGVFERCLIQHDSGVSLLAPPRNIADSRCITAEGVRQALALGRNLFPYVVIDLDHSFREEQVATVRQADLVLLVMRLDFTSLRNTQRTLDYLGGVGVSGERIRLVVNRYGQPKEVPAAKAEEALGLKIAHFIPDDPKTINRANNNGIPVVLESPSAKVSRSVTQLALSLNGKHKK